MDASLVQFVVAVFSAMLLQAWYLHREARRSHEETVRLIEKSHDRLRTDYEKSHDQLRTDYEKSHDRLRTDFTEHKRDTQGSHNQLRADFKTSHNQLRADFTEHKTVTERNHRETQRRLVKLGDGLGDARERLARIEGYLRLGLPEPPEPAAEG